MVPRSISFSLLIEDQGLIKVELSAIWDPLLLIGLWYILGLCHSFRSCAPPLSLLLQLVPAGELYTVLGTSLVAQTVKHLPTMWETWVQSLGQDDPLEKGMATHSTILAWRIPWMEEPGRLESDMTEQLHFTYILFQVRFL